MTHTRPEVSAPRSPREERGATTLEAILIFPLIFFIIFAVLQGAVWWHARNVATNAAQEGARVASAEGGTAEAGRSAADQFLRDAGGEGFLRNMTVTVDRDGTRAQVTIQAESPAIVPDFILPVISQSAAMPVERLTAPGGG